MKLISPKMALKHIQKGVGFTDKWLAAIGDPKLIGVWLVYGHSANGKSSFCMQLAKYLCNFGSVGYDSIEEGNVKSFQQLLERENMTEVNKKFRLLYKENINSLMSGLESRKSPRVVFIDSLQSWNINKKLYTQLIEKYPKKLFIFISRAEGKEPEGKLAKDIKYDAFVKIRVEGYKAFAVSRYGGGEPLTIWEDGASKYWTE